MEYAAAALGKEAGDMARKLIIEGTAVYEIDEECMLKKRLDREDAERDKDAPGRRKMRNAAGDEGKN